MIFFETEAKALPHLIHKEGTLTKFDRIHYTSTNGSEKPSLDVSNNSNVLPPQTAVTVADKQVASVCVRGAAE